MNAHPPSPCRFPALLLGMVSLLFALLVPSSLKALPVFTTTTLAQDDFSGGAVILGGTAADVGGTWKATTNYLANGTVLDGPGANVNAGAAILPFTPVAGRIYTLSATAVVGPATTAGAGIGLGFANKVEANWSANAPLPNTSYRFQGTYTPGLGWMWAINGSQAHILGSQAANQLGANTTIAGTSLDLKIVLNTTGANWTIDFYIGGILQRSGILAGTLTPTGGNYQTIDSVGFMNFGGRTAGSIDNLLLTELIVPEALNGRKAWEGDGSANVWDINTSANWLTNYTAGGSDVYLDGDNVVFDSFATNLTVNINTTVSPASVTVNSSKSYTFSGVGSIAGAASLTNSGTGTLTIGNANTYSGGTVLLGTGQLNLTNSAALGTGSLNLKSAQSGSTPTVLLDGGITITNPIVIDSTTGREGFLSTNGNNTLSGPITITGAGANAIILQNNGSAGSVMAISNSIAGSSYVNVLSLRGQANALGLFSAPVTLGAASTFQINGSANWTVASTGNTWGTTTIQGANGSLILGANDALPTTAKLSFGNDTSGALDLAGFNQTVAGLEITTTANTPKVGNSSTTSDSVLKINGNGYTFAGQLVDTLGSGTRKLAVELLSGTQTLSAINAYTGGTTVRGGTLKIGNNNAFNKGSLLVAGGTVDLSTYQVYMGTNTVSMTAGSIIGSGGLWTTTSFNLDAGTVSVPLKNSAFLAKSGAGTLTLTAANLYTGDTTISAGTLALTGTGSIASSTNIYIAANAKFDVSGLSSTFALGASQKLAGSGTNGTINGNVNLSTGALALTYTNGISTLIVTNGTLTFSGNAVTVTVVGTALPAGNYKLIAKGTGGSVAGTLPGSVTVDGAGVDSGTTSYLQLADNELYLIVNHPPVANDNTYSRNGLNTWMISVANLLTNATDVDSAVTLSSVGTSTNGVTLVISGGQVMYANTNLVDDQFSYTVADSLGATASGVITLTAGGGSGVAGQVNNFTVNGGVASMSFAGIPGYLYHVQRSTNVVNDPWVTIWTTNAPAGGVFQFEDNPAPQPDAFYRLMWNGN